MKEARELATMLLGRKKRNLCLRGMLSGSRNSVMVNFFHHDLCDLGPGFIPPNHSFQLIHEDSEADFVGIRSVFVGNRAGAGLCNDIRLFILPSATAAIYFVYFYV